MELDPQSLFGLQCTAGLIRWDLATPPHSRRIWAKTTSLCIPLHRTFDRLRRAFNSRDSGRHLGPPKYQWCRFLIYIAYNRSLGNCLYSKHGIQFHPRKMHCIPELWSLLCTSYRYALERFHLAPQRYYSSRLRIQIRIRAPSLLSPWAKI